MLQKLTFLHNMMVFVRYIHVNIVTTKIKDINALMDYLLKLKLFMQSHNFMVAIKTYTNNST